MRFDPKLLSNVSDNVMVVKWLPQEDLLGELLFFNPNIFSNLHKIMQAFRLSKNSYADRTSYIHICNSLQMARSLLQELLSKVCM